MGQWVQESRDPRLLSRWGIESMGLGRCELLSETNTISNLYILFCFEELLNCQAAFSYQCP